jgi:hypothetical protein
LGQDCAVDPITAAELRARQEASRARIAAAARRAETARTQLAEQRCSASSPDGTVTVTVDAAGTLLDLGFGPIGRLAPDQLARTILATYGAATRQAVTQTQALLRELVGPQSPVLDLIAQHAPTEAAE